MAFATRAQIYEISNDYNIAYRQLHRIRQLSLRIHARERLPTSRAFTHILDWAENVANQVYENMIHWNDSTRISNELYMNAQGPAGGERGRIARTDIELERYQNQRRMLRRIRHSVGRIDREALAELNHLRSLPPVPAGAPVVDAPGGPMGGSGKPGKSRGDQWHNGQNRRYM